MFRNFGAPELIIILVVLFLLFGAKRLPDLSRSLGRSMRIFKSEVKEMKNDDSDPGPRPDPKPIEGTVHRDERDPLPQSVPTGQPMPTGQPVAPVRDDRRDV